MFMKQDAPSAEVCRWRIQSEGIPILQGYVGQERVVVLRNKETFRRLLIEMFPRISEGEWQKLNEIGERVRDIGMGCLVLRVEPDGTDEDFSERMVLPLWKSFHSLNLMLPKEDRSAMLLRIYNDTTPLVNSILKRDQTAAEQKTDGENGAEAKAETAVEAAIDGQAVVDTEAVDDDGGAPADPVEEATPAPAPAPAA
jgi:multisite-specific tRNA:(cytosine-C5)-methyltransferase